MVLLVAVQNHPFLVAPLGIGLSIFVGEVGGVYYTGGSMNPARSFGPNVIEASFQKYDWIYCNIPF